MAEKTPPFLLPKMSVSRATEPMNDTGMCQVMTLRTSRYTPPMSSASALTSPRQPGIVPRNMDLKV